MEDRNRDVNQILEDENQVAEWQMIGGSEKAESDPVIGEAPNKARWLKLKNALTS